MASLKDLAGDQKPVVAYPKNIQFGPIELEGFMLESGEFRQSIRSTGRVMGMLSNAQIQTTTARIAGTAMANPSDASGSELKTGENTANPVIVPVKCPGVDGYGGKPAYTINLPMVVEIWKQVAMSDSKYSKSAFELLGLSAVHSLERTYQEAFGVKDSRSTEDRLLDWAIRLDTGKHFPMFGGQFYKHFARVTGVAFGHPYAALCLGELIYQRLPKVVYETLKDLNPIDEKGLREFTHSQLMTDDMRQYTREIVMTVTNQLANTPAKADDPLAYRKLLGRLDKTLPRHNKRGVKPGAQRPQFKECSLTQISANNND
ncbi:MAG: hypothetical protein EBV86_14955 [Marivivens sp.]|nr:hypothetical protein [Marivivens sp.]NCW69827.1 hypothetical protein [Marivivens sp.]